MVLCDGVEVMVDLVLDLSVVELVWWFFVVLVKLLVGNWLWCVLGDFLCVVLLMEWG